MFVLKHTEYSNSSCLGEWHGLFVLAADWCILYLKWFVIQSNLPFRDGDRLGLRTHRRRDRTRVLSQLDRQPGHLQVSHVDRFCPRVDGEGSTKKSCMAARKILQFEDGILFSGCFCSNCVCTLVAQPGLVRALSEPTSNLMARTYFVLRNACNLGPLTVSVACRDWFQLTLKEGLTVFRDQLFSGDMGSHAIKRIEVHT